MCFYFFPVLDPYRLVISFVALIHIAKMYLHQTVQMSFLSVLKMFQDKCNLDCNHDDFQCNRNRLHCDFVYS